MLAMVLYPDVMRKAQAEIDRVVGRDRLPNFGDYDNLPYMRAMVKEVLRWRPVGPLGKCSRNYPQLFFKYSSGLPRRTVEV